MPAAALLAAKTTKVLDIVEGRQNVVAAIAKFQSNIKKTWCACVDSAVPAFSMGAVRQGYVDARKRGVRIMYITEITKENLPYCREIMKVAELRHLAGVKANFALSESEYVAGVKEGGSPDIVRLVRSGSKELVGQQRLVFDLLWQNAIPAQERINHLA